MKGDSQITPPPPCLKASSLYSHPAGVVCKWKNEFLSLILKVLTFSFFFILAKVVLILSSLILQQESTLLSMFVSTISDWACSFFLKFKLNCTLFNPHIFLHSVAEGGGRTISEDGTFFFFIPTKALQFCYFNVLPRCLSFRILFTFQPLSQQ